MIFKETYLCDWHKILTFKDLTLNKLQHIINHGSCSYFVVLLFCAFSLLLGLHMQETLSVIGLNNSSNASNSTRVAGEASASETKVRIAVAERQAIIFDHALDFPSMGADERQRKLIDPILSVLQKYAQAGYLVVDALKDESGAYFVSALPYQALDITQELRAAISAAAQVPGAPNPSAQPKQSKSTH